MLSLYTSAAATTTTSIQQSVAEQRPATQSC